MWDFYREARSDPLFPCVLSAILDYARARHLDQEAGGAITEYLNTQLALHYVIDHQANHNPVRKYYPYGLCHSAVPVLCSNRRLSAKRKAAKTEAYPTRTAAAYRPRQFA